MKSGTFPSDRLFALTPQPEWRRQIDAWRDLLTQCARKPSRKRIHALRTLTLRLRVVLEQWLLEPATDPAAGRAFKRWNKEGKKLRRVLQPVRDADVYLARLDGLRNTLGGAPGGESQLDSICLREVDKLERRLKRQRQAGTDKLFHIIDTRGKQLRQLSKEMEVALAPGMLSRAGSTALTASRIFAGLASEFTELDSTNLHDYRKRLKQALYLAEISAAADPVDRQLADGLRKLHQAIGDWHDWQVLTLVAGRLLPRHAKQSVLVPILEKQAEAALQRALNLCRHAATQLLESVGEIHPSPPRKPVAADPGNRQRDEYLSLKKSS